MYIAGDIRNNNNNIRIQNPFVVGLTYWRYYMTKKKTAGQISMDLLQADPKMYDLYEIEEAALHDYAKKVENCINEGVQKYHNNDKGNFYVVVEAKRERLMPNVIRNFIFHRFSCPTPHYGQTVYRFNGETSEIEFLWVIPDKEHCKYMYDNALTTSESERGLLKFVLDFYDNTLLKIAKKLNNEHQFIN